MAKINTARITLTETTLRELLSQVERYKERNEVPRKIWVDSNHTDIGFEIELEQKLQTQESLGFSHAFPVISNE